MAVLEKIRVKLGAFITVLIAVALLSFIIDPDTLQSTMSMFSSKYDVGEIAGEGISYQDYQKKVEYYSSIYQMSNGSSRNDETQELINNTAWQSEIADRVVVPATLAAGLTLGEEEMYDLTQGNNISPVLSGEASFLDENGNFDRNRVLQFVQAIDQDETNNLGMYWQFLEDNVVKDQLFTKYVSLLGQSAYMNQVELANAIAENNTTYNVDFVMQPYGFAMDSTITVSNAEVKAYYDEHKESYKQVESKDIEYVVFEVAPSAEDIASAQEAFEDTYQDFLQTDNMKNFLSRNSDNKFNTMYFKEGELRSVSLELEKLFEKPKAGNVVAPFQEDNFFYAAKIMDVKQLPDSVFVQHILLQGADAAKADSIMAVAKKGNFAALAAEFSADQNPNVAEAGDLGWMTQQYNVPGFESIFFAKKGEMLKLNTQYGTHIVKIKDVTKPVEKIQVALLAKEIVASKKTYSEVYAKANNVVAATNGKIDGFKEAVAAEGASIIPGLRIVPSAKSVGSHQKAREVVRWINENEVGTVSPIITVENKYFFVVAVKEAHKEGYASMQEVYQQIHTVLYLQKKGEKVAQESKEAVAGATTIEAVAEKLNTTVSSRTGISFASLNTQKLDPKFIGAIAGAAENTLVGPVVGEIGVYYFVVKGKEVGAFYTEDDAKERSKQIFGYTVNIIPAILAEQANVVDQRYKFY